IVIYSHRRSACLHDNNQPMLLGIVRGDRVVIVNLDDVESLPDVTGELAKDEELAVNPHERRDRRRRFRRTVDVICVDQSPTGTIRLKGLPIYPRTRMQTTNIKDDRLSQRCT